MNQFTVSRRKRDILLMSLCHEGDTVSREYLETLTNLFKQVSGNDLIANTCIWDGVDGLSDEGHETLFQLFISQL